MGRSLIAAVALLMGSGLTLLVTHRRAVDEQKLTDKRRWDDRILDTAVQVETICSEVAAIGRPDFPEYIEDSKDRIARLEILRISLAKPRREVPTGHVEACIEETRNLTMVATEFAFSDTAVADPNALLHARRKLREAVRKELRAN